MVRASSEALADRQKIGGMFEVSIGIFTKDPSQQRPPGPLATGGLKRLENKESQSLRS